ncbi:bombesin receptor subtype-3-like [Mya arenaria]|uniref:bombesin receptor subtype-3-like n=1 Tax=Mya arenaria TaxID=6604 RepID=UPI0022DE9B5F|nr:bombesin receptor subtype-3-like [Mya arenaria]
MSAINMNSTLNTSDERAILERINAKTADQMTPVIAYLVILMCVGLFGNVLAVIFYGRNAKKSTHSVFICTVAIYDMIACVISIPSEIADLRLFFTYDNITACSILRFVNHFSAIGSIGVLLEISIDRFRRICRPVQKQLNHKQATLACAGSIIFSIFLSWPSLVFYTAVPVEVKSENGQVVTGHTCTTTKEASYRTYLWIFNFIYMGLFIIFTIILCVMYSIVGRVLIQHNRKIKLHKRPEISVCSTSGGMETSFTDDTCTTKQKTNYVKMATVQATKQKSNKNKTNHLNRSTLKFTMIMLVVTAVFVLSYLPFLVLVLWRAGNSTYESDLLSDSELVALQFGMRTYFLNSAINPFTYGFFNSSFREFVKKSVCFCYKRSAGRFKPTSSATQ